MVERKELAAVTVYGIDDGRSSARVILERLQAPRCEVRWSVTVYASYGEYRGTCYPVKRAAVEAFARAVAAAEVESTAVALRMAALEVEYEAEARAAAVGA